MIKSNVPILRKSLMSVEFKQLENLLSSLKKDMPKLLAFGIAPRAVIAIGLVPMGVIAIGGVCMGIITVGAVGMGLFNACLVGMGIVIVGFKVMGLN